MTECRTALIVRRRSGLGRHPVGLAVLCVAMIAGPVRAQILQRPLAIENARILTMDGKVIDGGTLLVKGPKIVAVGTNVKLPMMTKTVDARGGTLTPGLIDAYCAWGRSSGGSADATRRAEDAFDHYDTANLVEALRGGVTAVYLAPGNSTSIGGIGAIMRLAPRDVGNGSLGELLAGEAALCVNLASGNKPISRLKNLDSIRKQFVAAKEYRRSLEDYTDDLAKYEKELKEWAARREKEKAKEKKEDSDGGKKPATPKAAAEKEKTEEKTDAKKEDTEKKDEDGKPKKPQHPGRKPRYDVVLRALDREMPVRIVAHRNQDILNALELADEFSLDLILEGAAEAHLVAEQLAEANVLVVLGSPARSSVRRDDLFRRCSTDSLAVLTEHGVRWIVGTGVDVAANPQFLAINAQLAASRGGGDPLAAVTAKAADALGVDDRIGRLRPGLLADFVLWTGDPLDPASTVRAAYVGGEPVFEATDKSEKGGAE